MKRTTYTLLVLILFFLYPALTFAAGYTGSATISKLAAPNFDGGFAIIGSWTNVDGCISAEKFIVGQHSTDNDETRKAKYSTVLSAYMAGKTIELYVDGCNSHNQPIVKGIWMPSR